MKERIERHVFICCKNKLCKKELSNEIIAQVSLEHHELLSLDPASELPVIHTGNEDFTRKQLHAFFF